MFLDFIIFYIFGFVVWSSIHFAPPNSLVPYEPEYQTGSYFVMGFFVWWLCLIHAAYVTILFISGMDRGDNKNV